MPADVGGQLIAGVVALLTAAGGGVAWWFRRRDTQKDPIPKESAAVALSESAVTIMRGVVAEVRTDLERERQYRSSEVAMLRADLTSVQQAQDATRRELEDTRTDVQWLRATLGVAAAYIEKLLRWARSESRPPLPPLPSDLRNLIDPSLYEPTPAPAED